ncbi:crossover junction endonuclease EME1 protein [Dioscorea alata]|uniref:Crossover junction endonuclease EME1 protein n=2 Tax=Dioscorea alata TaxID=55571 RepID=A0ACB7VM17_DIOAL|nr:crossover junction endonuclease EME1 protein [Dioscorea alata]
MSHRSSPPIAVEIPSDDDCSPLPPPRRKKRLDNGPPPAVLVIADDPTPQKPSHPSSTRTPSFVAETPIQSDPALESSVSIVKCSLPRAQKLSGISNLICLESDNESEGFSEKGNLVELGKEATSFALEENFEVGISFCRSVSPLRKCSREDSVGQCFSDKQASSGSNEKSNAKSIGNSEVGHFGRNLQPECSRDFLEVDCDGPSHCDISAKGFSPSLIGSSEEKCRKLGKENKTTKQKGKNLDVDVIKRKSKVEDIARKKQLKEEKAQIIEERKRKRQQEKLQKEALKAEMAEMKKLEKEKVKWEKGKFAVKSIVAEIDARVVENGSVGGHLLTRLAEKGLSFRITSNPIEKSILWKMNVPDNIAQLAMASEVPYILLVCQAEEFCELVSSGSFMDHVHKVQTHYPNFTICYLTNKVMRYINKCEQAQYKNQMNSSSCWKRPPVEEVLSKLTTHFTNVRSRQCVDEAELADHVVGLTSSLASCQFRKKLTPLSVYANGSIIPKDCLDKNLIKKNSWLKALVAIPKVQPRFAIAIWKKYPTMRSLLNIYMDPNRSVHEKEFLLKDLTTEGFLGNEDRRLGEMCSKRVYRILMAQNGSVVTDDVENGADFFRT